MKTFRQKAVKIMRWRYNVVRRKFTDTEISAEIAMLKRKDKNGTLDSKTLPYFCRMQLAGLL